MTPEELRDWSARKMGWYLQSDMVMVDTGKACAGYFDKTGLLMYQDQWLPDRPESGQIWMLVERMRGLGFNFCLICRQDGVNIACFTKGHNFQGTADEKYDTSCLAIIKAAKATEE